MKGSMLRFMAAVALTACAISAVSRAAEPARDSLQKAVDAVIEPVMQKDGIHGMAIGIIVAGKPYVFNYGVASIETGQPVTDRTLFEIGSVSKTFTATLASYAAVSGRLSLSDATGKHIPALSGTRFGGIELVNLGTHTPGGMPLQVPDEIKTQADLLAYLKAWRPTYEPGTYRTYSNLSIGMLGAITAQSMDADFNTLMQQRLFPEFGMNSTYLDVPDTRKADYAEGYSKQGAPVRMHAGMLGAQAYGIKTTAADLLRFVQANIDPTALDPKLQQAVTKTHTGYFQVGPMTQDLIWEQFAYPVTLDALLEGNARTLILDPTPVSRITPPQAPGKDVWINKTGSTNGFGTYVAFVPQQRLGIVMLANKNFPVEERVRAAYEILSTLAASPR